jgi:hypothetical protein
MIMSGIEINSWEMIGSRVYRCLVLVSGHMVLSFGSFSILLLLSTLLEFPSCNSVAAFFGLMYYVHSKSINIMICGSHAYLRQKMGSGRGASSSHFFGLRLLYIKMAPAPYCFC